MSKPQEVNRDLSFPNNNGKDIACNLGSTIVRGMMESGKLFGRFVELEIRALTHVSDVLDAEEAPTVMQGNSQDHAIGLGAMGLHSFFATHQIMYGDEESLDFTNIYFMLLRYYALKASNNIAKERGVTFADFKESEYADGSFFDRYLPTFEHTPQTEKVRKLFKDIDLPTDSDWEELKQSIIEHGLYSTVTLALAP